MKHKKILKFLLSLLLLSNIFLIQKIFSNEIIVLPVKSNIKNNEKKFLEKNITKMLIAKLFIKKLKVLSYSESIKYKTNNITKNTKHNNFFLKSYLEYFNNQYIFNIHLTKQKNNNEISLLKEQNRLSLAYEKYLPLLKIDNELLIKHLNYLLYSNLLNKKTKSQLFNLLNQINSDDYNHNIRKKIFFYLIKIISKIKNKKIKKNILKFLNKKINKNNIFIEKKIIFDLIDPLVEKISQFFYLKNTKNDNNISKFNPQIEIIFVLNKVLNFKNEISKLKNNLLKIIKDIHCKNNEVKIKIGIINYDYNNGKIKHLPLTNNFEIIVNYLQSLYEKSTNKNITNKNFNNLFKFSLYKALTDNNWSFNKINNFKFIFTLIDSPIQKNKKNKTNKLIFMPFKFKSNKIIQNINNFIHHKWTKKLKKDLKNNNLSFSEKENILIKNKISKKINNHTLQIKGSIIESLTGYKLTLSLINKHQKKIIYKLQRYSRNLYKINQVINEVNQKLIKYIKNNFKKLNKKNHNNTQYNYDDLILLAQSKKIKVYSIGFSEINKNNEIFLNNLTNKMGGKHLNLQYNFSIYSDTANIINFVYFKENIYEIIKKDEKINSTKNKLKLINLEKDIKNFKEIKNFLKNISYPKNATNWFMSKINNNICDIITTISKNNIPKSEKYDKLLLETKNYKFIIPIKLLNNKITQLKKWIKNQDEVYIASPIMLTCPYLIKTRKNNSLKEKILFFNFHPKKLKIFSANASKILPQFMINSVNEIEKKINYLDFIGFKENKIWLLKGKIKLFIKKDKQ